LTRLSPQQLIIMNLEGKIPQSKKKWFISKEDAYEVLKGITGEDCGYDAAAWRTILSKRKDLRWDKMNEILKDRL